MPRGRGTALRRAPTPFLALLLLVTTLLTVLSSVAGGARPIHPVTARSAAGTALSADAAGGGTPVLTTLADRGPDGGRPRAAARGLLDDERLGLRPHNPAKASARQGRGQAFAPLLAVLFGVPTAALPWLRPERSGNGAPACGRDPVRHPSRGPPPALARPSSDC